MFTEGFYTIGGTFVPFERSAEEYLLFFTEGADVNDISGYYLLDKNDLPFGRFTYAEALIGQAGDGDIIDALREAVAAVSAHGGSLVVG